MPLWAVLLARLLLGERLTPLAGAARAAGAGRRGHRAVAAGRRAAAAAHAGRRPGRARRLRLRAQQRDAAARGAPARAGARAGHVPGRRGGGRRCWRWRWARRAWCRRRRAPAWPWVAGALGLGALFLLSNLTLQYGAARLSANATAVVMVTEVLFASVSALLLGAGQLSLPLVARRRADRRRRAAVGVRALTGLTNAPCAARGRAGAATAAGAAPRRRPAWPGSDRSRQRRRVRGQLAVVRRHQHQHRRAAADMAMLALDVLAQRQPVERAAFAQFHVDEDEAVGALRQQFQRAGAARCQVAVQPHALQPHLQIAQRDRTVVDQQRAEAAAPRRARRAVRGGRRRRQLFGRRRAAAPCAPAPRSRAAHAARRSAATAGPQPAQARCSPMNTVSATRAAASSASTVPGGRHRPRSAAPTRCPPPVPAPAPAAPASRKKLPSARRSKSLKPCSATRRVGVIGRGGRGVCAGVPVRILSTACRLRPGPTHRQRKQP